MLNDSVMIVHKLPKDLPYINIYCIGDKHIGSRQCNLKLLESIVEEVKNDELGYVVYCGDMLDMGLKNSKTNVYEQTMMPHEQKECFCHMFAPLASKTLAGVPGNHCDRMSREVGVNPMYDVFCRWGIEDVYRENSAILKVNLGEKRNRKQVSYGGVVLHGSSAAKHHRHSMCYDGIDFVISGHTHTPSYTPRGKIRVDLHNEKISRVGYKEIVVDSGLEFGGYAIKKEYETSAAPEIQILKLYGDHKHSDFIAREIPC